MTKRELNAIVGVLNHCDGHTKRESDEEETVRWVAAALGDMLWGTGSITLAERKQFDITTGAHQSASV